MPSTLTENIRQRTGLNQRFGKARTDWQIRPTRREPLACSDHTGRGWDARVLRALVTRGRQLTVTIGLLAGALQRLDGYAHASPRPRPKSTPHNPAGSMLPTSTPATPSGSNCTKTCSRP